MIQALGRGLGALLPSQTAEGGKSLIQKLPIDKIKPNRLQTRKYFDPEKLSELAQSIKEHGLAQPIIVTLDGGGTGALLTPGWLALVVNEFANGNQDINADGVSDQALLLVDTTTAIPTVYNPHLNPSAAGNIPLTGVADVNGVVVRLIETANNAILNGDGDTSDKLLFYISFATPSVKTILTATGGDYVRIVGGKIGITAIEADGGQDLNGDADTFDFVFRMFNIGGALVLPGLPCAQNSVPASDDGTLWAYLRNEVTEVRDLNGDGDQLDRVLGVWRP